MSIFNPWVILGFIFALGGAAATGYHKGVHSEQDKQKLIIAGLNEEARTKEQALVAAVSIQSTQLMKANQNAKLIQQKRNADLDSGALRLRVPVSCPVQAAGNAPAAAGTDSGSAELQPETARAVLAVGDDADQTARKLATCVTLYNQVRETLKGKP